MERWKPILGYECAYAVSNRGRVKSIPRRVLKKSRWGGFILMRVKGGILYQFRRKTGYRTVSLFKEGVIKNFLVHKLVCDHFRSNPNRWPEVNHRSGNKDDNSAANLRHCTRQQNHDHAKRNGLLGYGLMQGERNGCSKLTDQKVKQVRTMYGKGESVTCIAKRLGLNRNTLYAVVHRRSWKHL